LRSVSTTSLTSGSACAGVGWSTASVQRPRTRPDRSTTTATIMFWSICSPIEYAPSGLITNGVAGWPRVPRSGVSALRKPSFCSSLAMLEMVCGVSAVSRAMSARVSRPCRRTASITTRRLCDRANSRLVPDRLATGGLFTGDMMAALGASLLR